MEAKGTSASRALAGIFSDVPWKPNWRSSPGYSSSSTATTPGTTSTLSTPSPSTNRSGRCTLSTSLPTDGVGISQNQPVMEQCSSLAINQPYKSTTDKIRSSEQVGLSWWVCEDREKQLEFIKRLFDEFCVANGDASVLERWLPEMVAVSRRHVAAGDASHATTSLLQFSGSWIQALTDIAACLRNAYLTALFTTTNVPEGGGHVHVQLARFTRAFILKMSPFVDAIVAPCFCRTTDGGGKGEIVVVADGGPSSTAAEKLQPLLGVREAVSRASQDMRLSFCSTSSMEAKRITDEMASLLLSKEGQLDEAIWSIIQEVRAGLLPSTDPEVDDGLWWGAQILRGSSIHRVTRAVVSYISLLSANSATVHRIVGQFAARSRGYVYTIDSMSPLNTLIMQTVSGLDEKLAEKSRSFPDQSLRILFLINNYYYLWQHLYTISVPEVNKFLEGKIDNYVETYLKVSWEPVLSCLCSSTGSTPLCFGKNCSLVPKFESEFQKIYNAQKFWKVPDPKLRRRLRVAVIEKVVSSFTKYLEHNDISPSRITPHDLMDMLQELFEG